MENALDCAIDLMNNGYELDYEALSTIAKNYSEDAPAEAVKCPAPIQSINEEVVIK